MFIARSERAEPAGAVSRWAVRRFPIAATLLLVVALAAFVLFGDGALAVALGAALLLLLDAVRVGDTY